jgi:DNA-binding response OmpR family regulator
MSSPSSVVPGKLKAAASEKAGALPPSRRGASYTLTKAKNAATQTQKSVSMQVIGALNRPSHYERYGTIELLLNLGQDSELLQLLKAEGYDCLVMDSDKADHPHEDSEATGDLLQVFNSQDVYPDVVLLDCDQPLSNTAIIRALQSQQPLASIICIGAVDSKMDAISCLQAGAVDYLTKPLDAIKQEELLARIERHVARQHGSKVSIEAALSEARAIISRMEQMEQIRAATANIVNLGSERALSFSSTGPLGAVEENIEYEEQAEEIAQLQSENEELKQKIEILTAKLEDNIV